MALDRDLNLESIRESIFMNILFGESNRERIDSVDYHRALMEDYSRKGRYNNVREMTQDYLLWQEKLYRSRD